MSDTQVVVVSDPRGGPLLNADPLAIGVEDAGAATALREMPVAGTPQAGRWTCRGL